MRQPVAIGCVLLSASAASAQTMMTFDPRREGPSVERFARIGGYVEDGMIFGEESEQRDRVPRELGALIRQHQLRLLEPRREARLPTYATPQKRDWIGTAVQSSQPTLKSCETRV